MTSRGNLYSAYTQMIICWWQRRAKMAGSGRPLMEGVVRASLAMTPAKIMTNSTETFADDVHISNIRAAGTRPVVTASHV